MSTPSSACLALRKFGFMTSPTVAVVNPVTPVAIPGDVEITLCEVCDSQIMGDRESQNYKQHVEGKNHKRNLQRSAAAPSNVAPGSVSDAGMVPLLSSSASNGGEVLEPPKPKVFVDLAPSSPCTTTEPGDEIHRIVSYRLSSRDEVNARAQWTSANTITLPCGKVYPGPSLKSVQDNMYKCSAAEIATFNGDVICLQHVDGKGTKELLKCVRNELPEAVIGWEKSPRIPAVNPFFHHIVGYKRERYVLEGTHMLKLNDLVDRAKHLEHSYSVASPCCSLNTDYAIAFVCALRDKRTDRFLIVCSVELPHAPDDDVFRVCCIRELQREVGRWMTEASLRQPAVVLCGDFGSTPASLSYRQLTTASATVERCIPLEELCGTLTGFVDEETSLMHCEAMFRLPVCGPGDARVATELLISCESLSPQHTLGIDSLQFFQDGSYHPVNFAPRNSRHCEIPTGSGGGTHRAFFSFPFQFSGGERCGVVRWREPRQSVGAACMPSTPSLLSALSIKVKSDGIGALDSSRTWLSRKFPPQWDDKIAGVFRSAFSHYRHMSTDRPQISNSADFCQKLLSLLSSEAPSEVAPLKSADEEILLLLLKFAGNTTHVPISVATVANLVRNKIVEKFMSTAPQAKCQRAPFSTSSSLPLIRWLTEHYDSPLKNGSFTQEPHFTVFSPVVSDEPLAVTSHRAASRYTTPFDKRRLLEKFGFEFGTTDYVLYLRDRMEVVRVARLPTLEEVGFGMPSATQGSSHLALCVDLRWPK